MAREPPGNPAFNRTLFSLSGFLPFDPDMLEGTSAASQMTGKDASPERTNAWRLHHSTARFRLVADLWLVVGSWLRLVVGRRHQECSKSLDSE